MRKNLDGTDRTCANTPPTSRRKWRRATGTDARYPIGGRAVLPPRNAVLKTRTRQFLLFQLYIIWANFAQKPSGLLLVNTEDCQMDSMVSLSI